jgi:hypothetical protein
MNCDAQNDEPIRKSALFIRTFMVGVLVWMGLIMLSTSLTLAQSLSLTVSPSSISFPDANPTSVPNLPASSTVQVVVNASGFSNNATWGVRALAGGDLLNSDGSVIPISNLSWTASGSGICWPGSCSCQAGIGSKTNPQTIISGSGVTGILGFGNYTCNVNFSLVNRWSYNTGSYAQNFTITASNP